MDVKIKLLVIALVVAALIAYWLGSIMSYPAGELIYPAEQDFLPSDLKQQLNRFTFINHATNETLREFRVLTKTAGTYVEGGVTYETYVVGFEDRYGGAQADRDFFDLIVELKRARGGDSLTVRIVQLGLDTIDVYLDEKFLGSVRPTIEVSI